MFEILNILDNLGIIFFIKKNNLYKLYKCHQFKSKALRLRLPS